MSLETEIAALEAAIAGEVLTIESDGERVTYRSVTELASALAMKRQALASQLAPGAGRRSMTSVIQFER